MKNNTSRIADFSQLVENLKETGNKKNVAVVWAEDSHTLEAVEMAYEAGFANPILVCSQQTAEKYEGKYEILLADNPQDASEKAVALVREGRADALMKGFVNTDVLLRAILDKEKGILPKGSVLTHITAAKLPPIRNFCSSPTLPSFRILRRNSVWHRYDTLPISATRSTSSSLKYRSFTVLKSPTESISLIQKAIWN